MIVNADFIQQPAIEARVEWHVAEEEFVTGPRGVTAHGHGRAQHAIEVNAALAGGAIVSHHHMAPDVICQDVAEVHVVRRAREVINLRVEQGAEHLHVYAEVGAARRQARMPPDHPAVARDICGVHPEFQAQTRALSDVQRRRTGGDLHYVVAAIETECL